jgi:cytochrome P450
MALYPDVQAKAQEEIDRVVGKDRLPKGSDRVNLKYVDSVMREVMRLNPVAPLGEWAMTSSRSSLTWYPAIPHRLRVDDNFRGYDFPKGSIVYANSWKILHDESIYPEPFAFKPERYMVPLSDPQAEKERDPLVYAFGYGRRICPGLHLAEASMFLSMAMTLSTYDIRKKRDADGNVIEPKLEYSTGSIRSAFEFCEDQRGSLILRF